MQSTAYHLEGEDKELKIKKTTMLEKHGASEVWSDQQTESRCETRRERRERIKKLMLRSTRNKVD